MNRYKVLDRYIKNHIEGLSAKEREQELHEVWFSDWSNAEGWEILPLEIRESMLEEILPTDYQDIKYDDVLFFKFRDMFKGIRNNYLTIQTGFKISSGKPNKLDSCPCCGLRTIEKRYDFEICTVCWWEDDGQDNENADTILGGPNYGLSLTQARLNFIRHGIYDRKRKDLIEIKDEPIKFEKERFFQIQNGFLIEVGTEWKTKIKDVQ